MVVSISAGTVLLGLAVVFALFTSERTDFSCAAARRAIDKPTPVADKPYDHFESEMTRVKNNTKAYTIYRRYWKIY